jgi:hypothetical protein
MPRPIRRLALFAALLLSAPACNSVSLPDERTAGEYVFQVEYANFAWFPSRSGIVVDTAGGVWEYDYGEDARPEEAQDSYTGAELRARYAHGLHLLRRIDPAEVSTHAALIGAAADGSLTEPEGRCADAGVTTFTAFRYHSASDTYTPVLLYQQGDVARLNHSAAAAGLTTWLRGLDARYDYAGCAP